jgi:hypothetical protein
MVTGTGRGEQQLSVVSAALEVCLLTLLEWLFVANERPFSDIVNDVFGFITDFRHR